MICIGAEEDPRLAELIRDIANEFETLLEEDRNNFIECIRDAL